MQFSAETENILKQLDRASNGLLTYRDDVGDILELARTAGPAFRIDDLAIAAKACWKIAALMKKMGSGGLGADMLAEEFRGTSERFAILVRGLYEQAGDERQTAFERLFFSEELESRRARLELCHDLSWLKNISIDTNMGPK